MITHMNNKTLHICYITDVMYLQYTVASIYSIIRRKDPDTTIQFYVIGDRLQNKQFDIINKFNSVDNISVTCVAADTIRLLGVGVPHLLKMLIPDFDIFKPLHKLLYIDGDQFARKDVSTVYHTDLDGYSIGMVKDAGGVICKGISEWPQPNYFHKDFYYNTGLILMDLDKMRENKVHHKWIDYLKTHGVYSPFDQPAINYTNHYDCKTLPLSYQLSYHNLIRYPDMHVHKVEKWNQYYGTNYASIKEMVDASYFWHFHEKKAEMTQQFPLIARIFSLLFSDYDKFAQTGIVQPWEPKDDALFYINPDTME